jgi:hypothetical protein
VRPTAHDLATHGPMPDAKCSTGFAVPRLEKLPRGLLPTVLKETLDEGSADGEGE